MGPNNLLDQVTQAADRANALYGDKGQSALLLPEVFEELHLSLEELRVAEEELRQQNDELLETRQRVELEKRRYQELFDFAPNAYFVTDPNGVILEANQAASQMLGIRAPRLTGKPLTVYVAPADRPMFRTLLNQSLHREIPPSWTTTLRSRLGVALPIDISVSQIRSRTGELVGLRWMARERRLQEADLESMLEGAPVGMALIALDQHCLHVNAALDRIHGRHKAGPPHRHIRDVMGEEAWPTLEPLLQRALEGESPADVVWSIGSPAGASGSVYYQFSCYPIRVGDMVRAAGLIVQDVTARIRSEQAQQRDLEHNRRIADTLQTALMKTVSENAFPGMSVATIYKAASDEANIGGDFYDAFQLEDGRVALVVGDVSGKGLAAAAHISEVKYALRAFLHETPQPGRAFERLNDFVCQTQRHEDWESVSFVVLALALMNPKTGEVSYASAGAEPLLVLSGDTTEVEEHGVGGGLLLGIAPSFTYQETHLTLAPGNVLLMTTDGITEARRDGEMLGVSGLKRLAREALPLGSVGEISSEIIEGARRYCGGLLADDACLLLARRHV